MIHEECGVFGIWQAKSGPVAQMAYTGLFALQHRGQEAAGIALSDRGVFRHHKDVGLVSEVFAKDELDRLGEGNIAVGHVRYSTSGNPGRSAVMLSRSWSATGKETWLSVTTAIWSIPHC